MRKLTTQTRSKWLLVCLLSLLMTLGGTRSAWAQQALPYSYGFEESTAATSGWTKVDCHANTENNNLGSSTAHGGSYAFRFYYNSNPPQYLISPELETTENTISVSFWYKAQSTTYEESFKFGYSSTDNDIASFTWEDEVKTKSTTWTEYTTTCPAGTKYISIQYTGNDKYYLFVDDILVKENVSYGMSISGSDVVGNTISFGTVRNTTTTKTFTINNEGVNALTNVSVVCDDASVFTVSDTGFDIAAGETMDITVTFVKGVEGDYSQAITVSQANIATPIALTVTGTYTDNWGEDFDEATEFPTGWTGGTWTIGTFSSYEDKTKMALAPNSSTAGTMITPRLSAKAGDVLTWDAYFKWADEPLIVEYSDDNMASWTSITTIYGTATGEKGSGQVNYHKGMSFTAPADGNYNLRFTSTYQNGIDNFNGFKYAPLEHDAQITAQSIPTTGNEGVEYTATVTVKEMAGKAEELTAKFFIGSTQYGADAVETVEAGGTKTFTVTFTPEGAISGNAHFTITNSDIDLTSDNVAVVISAAPQLDETVGSLAAFENWGSYPVVKLNYSLKAGWNTIILPFAVNDITIFGANAKAFAFTSYSESTIRFTNTDALNAQTPYILYADEAKSSITFMGVTNFRTSEEATDLRITNNGVIFQGTYAPIDAGGWTKNAETDVIYGVSSAGKIAPAKNTTTMKGFRAYFDLPAGTEARLAIYDEATGITTILDATKFGGNGKVYNLSGQQVQSSMFNAQSSKLNKGIYIVNGKKVVVK